MMHIPTRRGIVRQITTILGRDKKPHIQHMSLTYGDGGGSIPVPIPFLGGCGDPTTATGQKSPNSNQKAVFFGFIAVPRQGDEVAVHHAGRLPIAVTSATTGAVASPNMGNTTLLPDGTTTGVDARFPNLVSGETGQFDGDGLRQADVFHSDGSTTLFDFHGAGSITTSPDGTLITITAPNGLDLVGPVNISGDVRISGNLYINGVLVTAP